jgi:hypothetical protein
VSALIVSFEAQVIKKLIAIFALSAMTIIPLHSALARDNGHGREKGARQFRLGELMLTVTERPADGDYLLKFLKDHEELIEGACAFKTHEPKTVPNTPLPNCRTLLAYCFSGGAHCCTTLFIATACGPGMSLDMVDFGNTDAKVTFVETKGAPGKLIRVHDWQFAYYGPEDSQIELSFADSPAMSRLLVFDNGHWRVDRVGEFTGFYSPLLREAVHKARISARRNEPALTASLAMKAAYYDLMNGKSVEEGAEVLNRLFPEKWKPQAGKITQDIRRAISEFDPVEPIR